MSIAETFVAELVQECEITRRFLERLPADKLSWRPHEKSNTAGGLALHIAQSPGALTAMALQTTFDMGNGPTPGGFNQPGSVAEIVAAHDQGTASAISNLRKLSDADFHATWTMVARGKTIMALPRVAMVRAFVFSHTIQHRGQFSVYLRLLGVKVPWSYGPSGDELPPFLA